MTKLMTVRLMSITACVVFALPVPAEAQSNQQEQAQATEQVDSQIANEEAAADAEILNAGPMHEAFLELAGPRDESLIRVEQEPPEAIEELPPEYKPDGENVQWIPGYWMWDETREDFIWISGVWRNVPQGRRWLPGHWSQVGNAYQWTPGVWIESDRAEVELLPPPPQSLEEGPSAPAPSTDHIWIPGCWTWRSSSYSWRPGFWHPAQANWIWVPNRYVMTPRGSIFVPGYWDYPIARRGLPYASVYWPGRAYSRSGFYYRPANAVNTALLITSLFVNSSNRHYYYGYNDAWSNNNSFYPWYDAPNRGRYDALYNYYRWQNRANEEAWAANLKQNDDRIRSRANRQRPDGDRSAQETLSSRGEDVEIPELVRDANWLESNAGQRERLHRVSEQEAEVARQQVQRSRDLRRNLREATSVKQAGSAQRTVASSQADANDATDRRATDIAENRQLPDNRRGNEQAVRRETFRVPTQEPATSSGQSQPTNTRRGVEQTNSVRQPRRNAPPAPPARPGQGNGSVNRSRERPDTPQPATRARDRAGGATQVPLNRRNNRPNSGNGRAGGNGKGQGKGGGSGKGKPGQS